MFKKLIIAATLTSISSAALAGETVFLPVLKEGYKADAALALVVGHTKVDDHNNETGLKTKGVELSLNCPLLKPARHSIRQQMSITQNDEDGEKSTLVELNPHHMWKVNNKLSVGAGPSLGFISLDTDAGDDTAFTYGVGTSARYDFNKKFFVGADARYGSSTDLEIAGEESSYDSLKVTAKLGYQF